MVNLNEINPSERIKSSYLKTEIIRFVFIFYNLPIDIPHRVVKNLIGDYFVTKEGKDYYIQNNASEISKISRGEILNEAEIFKNFKNELVASN